MDIEVAKAAAEAAELEYIIVGDGSEVTAQSPSSGTIVSKISKLLVLYTGSEKSRKIQLRFPMSLEKRQKRQTDS